MTRPHLEAIAKRPYIEEMVVSLISGRLLPVPRVLWSEAVHRLRDRLRLDARTIGGATLGEGIEGAAVHHDDVIRTLDNAVYHEGSLAVLRGNLAPDGCAAVSRSPPSPPVRDSAPCAAARSRPHRRWGASRCRN